MNPFSLFNPKDAIDKISKGADALHYSAEEKTDLIKSLQDQYGPRSLSRRLIAMVMCFNFTSAFITGLIFSCLNKPGIVKSIVDLSNSFKLGWIIVTIVVFYFGYYGVGKILKK